MAAVYILFPYILATVVASEGSGAEQNVWIEQKDVPVNLNYANSLLLDYSNVMLNATLQIGAVQAVEEMRHDRLALTMWTHLTWQLPSINIPEESWGPSKKLKFNLNEQLVLNASPQTVFKNALYLHEHKTPLLNSILHINQDGQMELHSKITVDIPCVRLYSLLSKHLEYPVCGKELLQETGSNSEDVVCEMRYGSYVRDKTLLKLDWDTDAIDGQTSSCSSGLIPHCILKEIQTFKREMKFIGEEFDELVACFLLRYRNFERYGL